jgi:prepilin-type N-terminal cleavage/methylation domain-containing protein
MKHRPAAGMTLLEMLIAVLLLSLLSLGLFTALRVGLDTYQKTQSVMMDNRRVMGAQRILEQELEGLVPVPCGAGGGAIFFQGSQQSVRMVSTFSLKGGWRGPIQILEIFVIPGEHGRGVRLVVNELPYGGAGALSQGCGPGGMMTPSAGEKSFVLADRLSVCQFEFLERPDEEQPPVWVTRTKSRFWPEAVRIRMAPLEPDPSRLQPITVVAPLHILRRPEIDYVDQ